MYPYDVYVVATQADADKYNKMLTCHDAVVVGDLVIANDDVTWAYKSPYYEWDKTVALVDQMNDDWYYWQYGPETEDTE